MVPFFGKTDSISRQFPNATALAFCSNLLVSALAAYVGYMWVWDVCDHCRPYHGSGILHMESFFPKCFYSCLCCFCVKIDNLSRYITKRKTASKQRERH